MTLARTSSFLSVLALVAWLSVPAAAQESCGCELCGDCGCEACCGSDCDCCDCPCRSCGFIGGAELAWLKPHNSQGTGFAGLAGIAGLGGLTGGNAAVDPEYETAGRLWLGYQRGDGLGVRARYWEFDHTFDAGATLVVVQPGNDPATIPGATVFHGWDTYAIDLEVFDTTDLGCWDATWFAGFRYVKYEEFRAVTAAVAGDTFNVAALKDFSGIGLTTGFELRRQVTDKLALFANARGSILMGDEDNRFAFQSNGFAPFLDFTLVARAEQKNDVKQIYETQVGLEYALPICGGGYYFARAGVEMQYWDNFGVTNSAVLFDESAGFGGFFAAVGLNR